MVERLAVIQSVAGSIPAPGIARVAQKVERSSYQRLVTSSSLVASIIFLFIFRIQTKTFSQILNAIILINNKEFLTKHNRNPCLHFTSYILSLFFPERNCKNELFFKFAEFTNKFLFFLFFFNRWRWKRTFKNFYLWGFPTFF